MLTGILGQCPTGEMVKNPSAGFYRSNTIKRPHSSDVYLYTSFILTCQAHPLMMGFTRRSRRSKESPTAGLATRQPSVSCSLCNDIESLLDRWLHTACLHHSHKLVSLETAPSRAAPGLSNTVAYR
ncbi:hypothetical protein COCVIDRAFT_39592 [Bipolaris victoriae FI3]|uniref:Uncharacterized protein n=1 Tax=Bipolaris victoriae (strain FI3) TaxID=930091 RepID=W7EKQ6_BIPV3|nr:hypothetical protein COCVIDRAFT_39592 [Bipolaris victoriae FI3]